MSESVDNYRLTAVESAALMAALRGRLQPEAPVWNQLAKVRVRRRDWNGYGAYVEFDPFGDGIAPDPILTESGVAKSSINAPWRTQPMHCSVLLAEQGIIGTLEFFPIDGENWSAEEMQQLLFGPLEGLKILSR